MDPTNPVPNPPTGPIPPDGIMPAQTPAATEPRQNNLQQIAPTRPVVQIAQDLVDTQKKPSQLMTIVVMVLGTAIAVSVVVFILFKFV